MSQSPDLAQTLKETFEKIANDARRIRPMMAGFLPRSVLEDMLLTSDFNPLNEQIRVGYVDADLGIECPAAESDIVVGE